MQTETNFDLGEALLKPEIEEVIEDTDTSIIDLDYNSLPSFLKGL